MTSAGRIALVLLAQQVLGSTFSTATAATETISAELARCAAVATGSARLACYDALAGRPTADTGSSADPAGVIAQPAAAPAQPSVIRAAIARIDAGQFQSSSVVLDNGQVWVSTTGEMLVESGESVTIKRAALGSFILTSASRHSYYVRRVR